MSKKNPTLKELREMCDERDIAYTDVNTKADLNSFLKDTLSPKASPAETRGAKAKEITLQDIRDDLGSLIVKMKAFGEQLRTSGHSNKRINYCSKALNSMLRFKLRG